MPSIYLDSSDKPAIDRLRRKARRFGMRIEKARGQEHCNQRGGLQLIVGNIVLAGVNFDLGLPEADYWIGRYAQEAAGE